MEIIVDKEYLINDSTVGVANYLISLYESTKYKYYPTKINRLLTIYKLCSLKYNDKCLNDGDFIIRDDGTMGILRSVYSPFYNIYSSILENYSEIDEELEILKKDKNYLHPDQKKIYDSLNINYEKQLCISEDSKKLLELIFRKFGNYPFNDLAIQINEIVNNIPLRKSGSKNYIKLEEFSTYMYDNENLLKYNVVFDFIKKFDRLNIDKSYSIILENSNSSKKLKYIILEILKVLKFNNNDIFFDQPIEMGIQGKNLSIDFERAIECLNLEDKIDVKAAKEQFKNNTKILQKRKSEIN